MQVEWLARDRGDSVIIVGWALALGREMKGSIHRHARQCVQKQVLVHR
jgi:hypothetical protein